MTPTEALAELQAEVTANTQVDASATTLINGIADRIDAAVAKALEDNPGITPEQLQAITDAAAAMRASNQTLSAAVTANTPSGGAGTPNEV